MKMLTVQNDSDLLAVDIGGTSVKYGYWDQQRMTKLGKFKTPKTWSEMLTQLLRLPEQLNRPIHGVAISLPGSVNVSEGKISGTTAVPYLTGFPIREVLSDGFKLPVTIQNDANCAGLAEAWIGNAKDVSSVSLLVIGTGIGGSIIQDGKLLSGRDNFMGEFGYSIMDGHDRTLSDLASPVKMANRYTQASHSVETVEAPQIFERAKTGDLLANDCINNMLHWVSLAAYNLITSFNPDRLLIGGGISVRDDFLKMLRERVRALLMQKGATVTTDIDRCRFCNESNLIGAVAQFLSEYPEFSVVK